LKKKAEPLITSDQVLREPITKPKRLSRDSSLQYFLTDFAVDPPCGIASMPPRFGDLC
jgi:hypothetical protein